MNNLKKYSADLERTLITTPLIRRNKNGTVVLQESILKSRIKKLENLIEKALTPPTEQEVCEALSACAGKKIKYLPLTDENYECFTDGKYHYFVNDIDCNEVIEWLPCPVYIMSLIGRFYERLELMRDE